MKSDVVLYSGSLVVSDQAIMAQAKALGLAPEALIVEIVKHLPKEIEQTTYLKSFYDSAVGPEAFANAVHGVLNPRASGLAVGDRETFAEKGGDPNVRQTHLKLLLENISRVLVALAPIVNSENSEECLKLVVAFADRFKEDTKDFSDALLACIEDFRDARIWDVVEEKSDEEIYLFALATIMDDTRPIHEIHTLLVDPVDYFKSRELGSWPEEE